MAQSSETSSAFEIKFTSREVEVSAWGGLALLKRMLDSMDFRKAASQWDLPAPGSNRGYPPVQLIEQLLVSIWCGACRFTHLDVTRMDSTLTRLFGWTRVAGHKAIVRLFGRFDMMRHERVQASLYRWFFDTVSTLPSVTLDRQIPPSSPGMDFSRVPHAATTRTSAAGCRIIRCWPSWPRRAWWRTSGYVRAMPTVPTTCCNSSSPHYIISAAKQLDCCGRIAAFTIRRY